MRKPETLKELVYYAAERFGDEPFLREAVRKELKDTGYSDFRSQCDSVAAWLEEQFSGKVHAALIGATSSPYLTAWFGIQCSANVSIPLDNGNTAARIADEIVRSDSEVVFMDDRHIEELSELKALCPKVKYFVSLQNPCDGTLFLGDILEEYKDRQPERSPLAGDLAAILFTSGTTGQSKGVMLSHENLIDNTTCEPDNNYHGDKRMTVLPVHHVFCFTCDILCSLWFGRTVSINDSNKRIVKILALFRPTEVTVVPMISASVLSKMRMLAESNPDKTAIGREVFGEEFSVIYTGGAYLSPEIIDGYKEFGIEIAQGYGMTECSPRICTGIKYCPAPESVGQIVPGCEVRIVDSEIWVKSKSVMMGYYKNPEETAKSLTEDGWLRTGDLGYEKDGYLYITGRKKNLIILSNGENVSPEELENQFACFAPIKEIVVYSRNGIITAEVFPNQEYVSEDIQKEIRQKIDEVNDTFPPAKRIVNLILRDNEFPKTASKKIIRSNVGC